MPRILHHVLALPLILALVGVSAATAVEKAPVVILKLDDITQAGVTDDRPIHPKWARVTDFLRERKIKASYGIIGAALEQPRPNFVAWITDLHASGQVEFWNHGYHERSSKDPAGEFESGPMEQDLAALTKTQTLAREHLGIELKAFGPHWSGTTDQTFQALEKIPELSMVFFYKPKTATSTKFIFDRTIDLEQPTHVPNPEAMIRRYQAWTKPLPYLALQGHPVSWDDARFAGFVKAIDFLTEQGCVFMTPSEYLAQAGAR